MNDIDRILWRQASSAILVFLAPSTGMGKEVGIELNLQESTRVCDYAKMTMLYKDPELFGLLLY